MIVEQINSMNQEEGIIQILHALIECSAIICKR